MKRKMGCPVDKDYLEEDKAITKEFREQGLLDEVVPSVTIEAPLALPGDEVEFDNYRCKYGQRQVGILHFVETQWNKDGTYIHVYRVWSPDRRYYVQVHWVRKIS